jgi:hypothetical protein
MLSRARKSSARVAAAVAVSALAVGLLAPAVSAATTGGEATADQVPESLSCFTNPVDGGYYCDLNDIAGVLSGLLDPVFQLSCIIPGPSSPVCRVNTDNTPFSG